MRVGERVPRLRLRLVAGREHARVALRALRIPTVVSVQRALVMLLLLLLRPEVRRRVAQRRAAHRVAGAPAHAVRGAALRVRVQRARAAPAIRHAVRVRRGRVERVRRPAVPVVPAREVARGRVARGEAARHADHVPRARRHGRVAERLERHRVVELQAVGGHRRAPAAVEHGGRARDGPWARREGRRRRGACCRAVRGCEDAPPCLYAGESGEN